MEINQNINLFNNQNNQMEIKPNIDLFGNQKNQIEIKPKNIDNQNSSWKSNFSFIKKSKCPNGNKATN